jgi:hypothetical protein
MRAIDRHVGLRMQLRREELGISRELLAHQLKKPVERLTSYENGWARIEPSILLQLSVSLQLPLSRFFAELELGRGCPKALDRRQNVSPPTHLPVSMPPFAFRDGADGSIPGVIPSTALGKSTDRPTTLAAADPTGESFREKNTFKLGKIDPVIPPLACPAMAIVATGLWIIFILLFLHHYLMA